MSDLDNFLRNLPKAELHLHIEGTLEPEMMFSLAQKNGINLPWQSVEETRAAYTFNDLQSFLDLYYAGAAALVEEDDFYQLAMAYFARAHADGVVHSEIFFDPQTHTQRNVAYTTVLDGLERACRDARQQWGLSTRLILCFLRHLSEAAGMATLDEALPHIQRIHGFGLDSAEQDNPPGKFARLFDCCRATGLPLVAHAGEEGPAAYIAEALDVLKIQRIDHGVRILEDAALTHSVAKAGIALTICPLSNIQLQVCDSPRQHPLKKLIDAGLKVTINSDDPAYFGGYINQNFLVMAQSLNLNKQVLVQLARNSLEASFVSDDERAPWFTKLDSIQSELSSHN